MGTNADAVKEFYKAELSVDDAGNLKVSADVDKKPQSGTIRECMDANNTLRLEVSKNAGTAATPTPSLIQIAELLSKLGDVSFAFSITCVGIKEPAPAPPPTAA